MFLYIDPGTGSMLFSILIGVVSTLVFLGRHLFLKLKFVLSGGKSEKISNTKIPYIIFSDHKRYWNVFEPICDEFERRKIDLVYWTASPDDPALEKKYEHVKAEFIGEGNKAFARLNMMNARICLATTPGLDVLQWKRSRNVDFYVHILHMASDPSAYRMFGLDFYDAVLLTGPYQESQIRSIENLRKLPSKDLKIVGCTYMDSLKAHLDSSFNEKKDSAKTKTILLAPSWGPSGILTKYGSRILDALIETGYSIVVRPHPQSFTAEKEIMDNLMQHYPDSENFKWNRDNDNFSVLNESDILISDFSGVIFDYALVFGKPFIYADTSFDYAPYDAAWISEPLWTFTALPQIGIKLDEADFPRLKEVIDSALNDSKLKAGREKVSSECWSCIGESARMTVDYLVQKHADIEKPKAELGNVVNF